MATYTKTRASKIARRAPVRQGFFELARKHIVRGKAGGSRDLSKKIDKIVYGV